MKVRECRYCRKDVPILDEAEYARVARLHIACVEAVKQYRREHRTTLAETPLAELYRPVRETIQAITGATAFDMDEVIRHHRVSRWEKTE
jgi:hypothetical protein